MRAQVVTHCLLSNRHALCDPEAVSAPTTTSVVVPEFDRADRMRKALRVAGISVQDIAEYLGVARNTVSTWINGRIDPSIQTVRLWALRTGVPYEWLQTGEPPATEALGSDAGLPRLDSNQ